MKTQHFVLPKFFFSRRNKTSNNFHIIQKTIMQILFLFFSGSARYKTLSMNMLFKKTANRNHFFGIMMIRQNGLLSHCEIIVERICQLRIIYDRSFESSIFSDISLIRKQMFLSSMNLEEFLKEIDYCPDYTTLHQVVHGRLVNLEKNNKKQKCREMKV